MGDEEILLPKLVSQDDPRLVAPERESLPDGSVVFEVGVDVAKEIGTSVEPDKNSPLWLAQLVIAHGLITGSVDVVKGTVTVDPKK